jgi:hypothetical protein
VDPRAIPVFLSRALEVIGLCCAWSILITPIIVLMKAGKRLNRDSEQFAAVTESLALAFITFFALTLIYQ